MVIKYRPIVSLTTRCCQAQPGAMFDDSRHGTLPWMAPEEAVEHLRPQVFAGRVPSSIASVDLRLLDQMWEILHLKYLSFRTEDVSIDYHRYPR